LNLFFHSFYYAFAWAVDHFFYEGLAVFLMHSSAGISAILASCVAAFLVAVVTLFMKVSVFFDRDHLRSFSVDLLWEAALLLFYLAIVLLPSSVIPRRPALKIYAVFWALFHTLTLVAVALTLFDVDAGFCLYAFPTWTVGALLRAVITYVVVVRDSQYWLGLSEDSPDFAPVASFWSGVFSLLPWLLPCLSCGRSRRRPSKTRRQSSSLARSIQEGGREDDLLSEEDDDEDDEAERRRLLPQEEITLEEEVGPLHQIVARYSPGVPIIPMGALEFGKVVPFGKTETTLLYEGTLAKKPVLIKARYYQELTPLYIAHFLDSVAQLAPLRHPNILQVKGVCIAPPALCLISEIGKTTVYDLLTSDDGLTDLTWGQKLRLMADMASGVTFLHAQDPPVFHSRLCTRTFYVNEDLRVKIGNLELCRSHPLLSLHKGDLPDDSVWVAPEVSTGGIVTEKADCFTLALIFWEIVTGTSPFEPAAAPTAGTPATTTHPGATGRSQLADLMSQQDYRPPIPHSTPSNLVDLLHDMWAGRPAERPSLAEVTRRLEAMIEVATRDTPQGSRKKTITSV